MINFTILPNSGFEKILLLKILLKILDLDLDRSVIFTEQFPMKFQSIPFPLQWKIFLLINHRFAVCR